MRICDGCQSAANARQTGRQAGGRIDREKERENELSHFHF